MDTGLSTATISRALNEPQLVKESTRALVHKSVAKLGYKPHIGARLLAKPNSGRTICFLLSNRPFVHSVHARILQGSANEAEEEQTSVLFATCKYSPADSPDDIALPCILATNGLIDGIIAAGTNYANILPALDNLGLPYVLFGTNFIANDETVVPASIYTDDEQGGYQATRHLIDLGHLRIRFIGDVSLPWYRRRYLGYVKAMTERNLPCDPPAGSMSDGELEMGFNAVNDLCKNKAKFSALFVAGDEGAVGAIRALRLNGMRVPDDVSVVGFNDEESVRLSEPQLTTVRVPKDEAGAECVRMLQKLIVNGINNVKPVIMPTRLVVRESTRLYSRGIEYDEQRYV